MIVYIWTLNHLSFIFLEEYLFVGGTHKCGGQRTTYRSQFSPPTMRTLGRVLEIKPRPSGQKLLPAEPSPRPVLWLMVSEIVF